MGCTTTSRVFGIGKSVSSKKNKSRPFVRQQAGVFKDPQDPTIGMPLTQQEKMPSFVSTMVNLARS